MRMFRYKFSDYFFLVACNIIILFREFDYVDFQITPSLSQLVQPFAGEPPR